MTDLSTAAIPQVLDWDEGPAVMRFSPDPRPCLEYAGVQYRAGTDRYLIRHQTGDLGLVALLFSRPEMCFLMASAGTMFNDWWQLIREHPDPNTRPCLTAAAKGEQLTFARNSTHVPVRLGFIEEQTAALVLLTPAPAGDSELLVAWFLSLAPIKAALLAIVEYRTLDGQVPDVEVDVDGVQLPLTTYLDIAEEAADAIDWRLQP